MITAASASSPAYRRFLNTMLHRAPLRGGNRPVRLFTLLWGLAASVFFIIATTGADQRELKTAANEKIDAVLLLDNSGSMQLTDPIRLRDEGAKLFIQFLKAGDRLAIVQFSKDAKVVRPLSDFNPTSVEQISQQISKIENTGMYTDLLSGVQAAKELLESNARDGAAPVVIMLSDGKMEPDPAIAPASVRTADLFNSHLPELRARGIKIHTLSFSDQADKDTLAQIAAATDGLSMFTPTADKIHESYANLFLIVKKPQVLPLTSKGFKIDGDVQEATFYINRENVNEISIEPPKGSRIIAGTNNDKVKWFKGQKFDVVTILTPEPGDWKILGLPSNDSFATVLTNLKLATDWPSAVIADEDTILQARLYESDKPVVLPEMTGAVTYAFQITPTDKIAEPIVTETLHDEGKGGDRVVDDGIFSATVRIKEPGEYMLKVVSHAPTFDRYQHIPFRVKPRLISLAVETRTQEIHAAKKSESHHAHEEHGSEHSSHEESHGDAHGEPKETHSDGHHEAEDGEQAQVDYFVATLSAETRDLKDLELKVIAVDRARVRYEISLVETENPLRYEVPVTVLPNEGSYEVQAILQADGRNKKTIRANSEKLSYLYKRVEGDGPSVTVVAPKDEHVKLEQKTPTSESPSPVIPLLMVSVVNAVAAGLVFVMMQRMGKGPVVAMPVVQPLDSIREVLASLHERANLSEVDLSDPIFANRPRSSSIDSGAVSSAAISTGENEAGGEAASQAAEGDEAQAGGETASSEEAVAEGEESSGEEERPAGDA